MGGRERSLGEKGLFSSVPFYREEKEMGARATLTPDVGFLTF